MSTRKRHIGIIGAGLGGIVAGMYLSRRGHRVTILEKRADPLDASCPPGRCNLVLTLTKRGLDALDTLGILPAVTKECVPLSGRIVLPGDGRRTTTVFDEGRHRLFGIGRNRLNRVLHAEARKHFELSFRFNAKLRDLDLNEARVTIEEAGVESSLQFDTILGADGAYSSVRQWMQRRPGFELHQEYADQAATELYLPSGTLWKDERHVEHFLPREGAALLAFPNFDGSFTLALLLPLEGPNSAAELVASGRAESFFRSRFPEVAPFIPDLTEWMRRHPPEPMVSIRCGKWYSSDRVCLIGDAAHAFFPSSGQGANAAFEDCEILDRCLEESSEDFAKAFSRFYDLRKPATDALSAHTIAQSLASPKSEGEEAIRRELRAEIYLRNPLLGHSLFSNIAFTHRPYDQVIRMEAEIERIVERALAASPAEVTRTLEATLIDTPYLSSFAK